MGQDAGVIDPRKNMREIEIRQIISKNPQMNRKNN